MILSVCGLKCDECEFFNKSCTGCVSVKGSTFWAKEMMPSKVCPMYDCAVNKKGFKSCGECTDLPCQLFLNMKDPKSTDEEHQASIAKRVALLRN
ncbi:MAG: DUF3795 domain-containing protein [Bacteroidales bacterium]|jgi:hypothetical protein